MSMAIPAQNPALAQSAVAVSLTGTTSETVMATVTIPGGILGANGQVEIEALWSGTSSANSKTYRIRFGGTGVFGIGGVTTSSSVQAKARVANRNSQSSQICLAGGSGVTYGGNSGANTAMAIDTTADVAVTICGQLATSSETITLESYIVKVFPKA